MNVYTASTVLFVITIAVLNKESKATIPDPKARDVEGNEKTDVPIFAPDQSKLK